MPDSAPTELFHFTSEALPEESFHVTHFCGTEGLNTLFSFTLDLVSQNPSVDATKILSKPAAFTIRRDNGKDAVFNGYPSRFEQGGMFNGYAYYTVELRPAFWKLTQIVQSAIFLNKNIQDVAKELLTAQKFFSIKYDFRLTSTDYPTPEFAMQYGESVYDYILWRMEEQGAYFFFDSDGDKVIFADAPESHDASSITVHYSPASGLEGDKREEVLTAFTLSQTPLPNRVIVRSFDWKNPTTTVTGEATVSQAGIGDVYLTNENVESNTEAARIAKIRAKELICRSRLFTGTGSVPVLRPGVVFSLKSHYNDNFNSDYMVTEITHEGAQETFLSMGLGIPLQSTREHLFYRNTFTSIPSDVTYHPARKAPRTSISGVIRAFVAGAGSGAQAELDSYGRYKVYFPFDTSNRSNGNASCWIRMAQPQVGNDSGMSFPLLPGAEVTVAFLGGNPDRPVITGALPNGETGAITGSGNANYSGIRSPGGNQITFNDTDNKQGISLISASGLGLTTTDEAGSTTTSLTADDIISACGSTSLEWANISKTLFTGYKIMNAATKNKPASALWGTIINGVLGPTVKGLDTLSTKAAKDGANATSNGLSWGASGIKLAQQIASIICNIAGAIQKGHSDYSIGITSTENASSTMVQVKPKMSHLIAQVVAWAIPRVASIVADEIVQGGERSKAEDTYNKAKEVYDAETDQSTTVAAALAKAEAEFLTATQTYEASQKTDSDKATYEAAKKKYNSTKAAYKNVKNKDTTTVEEASKDAAKTLGYAKQNAIRQMSINEISNFLPDISAFITSAIGMAERENLGGVSVFAKVSNINMSAGSTISAHSTQGILLNATGAAPDSQWGIDTKDLAVEGYKINDDMTEKTPFVAINTKQAYTYAEIINTKAKRIAQHTADTHLIETTDGETSLILLDGLAQMRTQQNGRIELSFSDSGNLPFLTLTKDAITLSAKNASEGLFVKDKDISLKTANNCQLGMTADSVSIKSPSNVNVSGKDIELAATGSVKAGQFTFKGTKMTCSGVMELGGAVKIMGSATVGANSTDLESALSSINAAISKQESTMTTLKTAAETAKTKAETAAEIACKASAEAADIAVALNETVEKLK
ncbi:MAG: type VI secretion system tip protein VgrG [Desulfovibrio sp.]|nr:type VI secretion system tip protein VgrG [Desulfovibrio sp.]